MARIDTAEVLQFVEAWLEKGIKQLDVEIPQLELTMGDGDEEEAVLVISDLQVGHKTPTTTLRILQNRGERLAKRFLKIVQLHRNAYPIRRLHLFLLGDLIQSEDVGYKVGLDELEMVLMEQIFKGAVPILERLLLTLLPYFPDGIDVWTVSGNHGRLDKFHAESTNWDTLIYRFLEGRFGTVEGVRFHIQPNQFYQKVRVRKSWFLLFHGDQIRSYLNLPWYGLTRHVTRWQGSLPGPKFRYAVCGHFHVCSFINFNDVSIFVNGCWVTDDQWVLKKVAMASTAKQIAFGVHDRGVSWRYEIDLD